MILHLSQIFLTLALTFIVQTVTLNRLYVQEQFPLVQTLAPSSALKAPRRKKG
jgi:hypothetical protein